MEGRDGQGRQGGTVDGRGLIKEDGEWQGATGNNRALKGKRRRERGRLSGM